MKKKKIRAEKIVFDGTEKWTIKSIGTEEIDKTIEYVNSYHAANNWLNDLETKEDITNPEIKQRLHEYSMDFKLKNIKKVMKAENLLYELEQLNNDIIADINKMYGNYYGE